MGRYWRNLRLETLRKGLAPFALELVFLCLLALTALAVACEGRLLTRTVVLTPDAGAIVTYAYGDRESGGTSLAEPDPKRPLSWSCRLAADTPDRYCGFELLFDPVDYARGIDLSGFDSITLRLSYRGPGDRLSVYLKNHDPRYSTIGRSETNKFNRIDFSGTEGDNSFVLKLADFSVAEW